MFCLTPQLKVKIVYIPQLDIPSYFYYAYINSHNKPERFSRSQCNEYTEVNIS